MRFIKNFDYFRKASPEHTKPTVIGGLVSLLSLTSISLLFYYQVRDYAHQRIQKDTFIAQDPHAGQYLNMNINITFPNSPCYLIEMEVQSTISFTSKEDVYKRLSFTRLNRNGEPMGWFSPNFDDPTEVIQSIQSSVDAGEQCNVAGQIQLYKVTGKFFVSYGEKLGLLQSIRNNNQEVNEKLRLNHVINSLTFGNELEQEEIKKRFGNQSEHTNFDMFQLVDDDIYSQGNDMREYFYFIKLVPHIFIDHIDFADYRSYCYSLNHNSKQAFAYESITMIYDFSPVNMKLTKSESDFARFLVNLCAIIGGVFVIFGLFNRFLLSLKDSLTGNRIR